jgi:hypothetical protein
MVVTTVMTALCTVGIAFYVRFLVALSKECRHHRIRYLLRLQPDSVEQLIPEAQELGTSISRAA